MYDVTLHYPDADSTDEGWLYLPGEPIQGLDNGDYCPLCNKLLDTEPNYRTDENESSDPAVGDHRGFLVTLLPRTKVTNEIMHLRCYMDGVDAGSAGMVIGRLVEVTTGRHAAA